MRILLTGASSFTGYWFCRELASAGHNVTAPLRSGEDDGSAVRQLRLSKLKEIAQVYFHTPFGGTEFFKLLEDEAAFDAVCLHGAEVTNYRSLDFDPVAAFANNTQNCRSVFQALADKGAPSLIVTRSVFEGFDGLNDDAHRVVSAYGLAKTITTQAYNFYAQESGLSMFEFVIANPFGPFEEPRFTNYLVRTWAKGETAEICTPDYVRDNIPIEILALCYRDFVTQQDEALSIARFAPSYFAESQGAFSKRFQVEIGSRLGFAADIKLTVQHEFPEPRVRINTDKVDASALNFDETASWDNLAEYYEAFILPNIGLSP